METSAQAPPEAALTVPGNLRVWGAALRTNPATDARFLTRSGSCATGSPRLSRRAPPPPAGLLVVKGFARRAHARHRGAAVGAHRHVRAGAGPNRYVKNKHGGTTTA